MLDAKHEVQNHECMNKLDTKVRAQILHLLCEGTSMRAITGLIGVSINTVSKLLIDVGNACAQYHDDAVRGYLQSKRSAMKSGHLRTQSRQTLSMHWRLLKALAIHGHGLD